MNKRLLNMVLVLELLAFPVVLAAAEDAPKPTATSRPKEKSFRPGGRLTEQDEARIIEFTKKNMSELYERLVRMKESDPSRYKRMLSHLQYQVRMLQALPEEVRKAQLNEMRLRLEIFKTAKAWKAAAGEEKVKLEAKLTALMREVFDAEQTLREYRLKDLEKRLELLRKELETRKADREAEIAKQVKQIKADVENGTFGQPDGGRRGPRRGSESSDDKPGPPRKPDASDEAPGPPPPAESQPD